MDGSIVPSISVDNLLQQREAIAERARIIQATAAEAGEIYRAIVGKSDRFGYSLPSVLSECHGERSYFEVARYMKFIDAALWEHLLAESGLRTFMDAQARQEWDKAIQECKVPPLTRENIEATFKRLFASRGEMFEQGVVRLFRSLSWDFKTNLPHMLGKRIIVRGAVNRWAYGGETSCYGPDTRFGLKLDDLIRVLSLVDGKPEPDHRRGAYTILNDALWMRDGDGSKQTVEVPYLSVKGFRNGNAHVTFLPTAKVEALNKLIAKHYPGALPPKVD